MEPHDRFLVLDDAAADVVLHLQQLQQLPLQGEGGIGGGAPGDCDAPGAAATMPRRRAPKTWGGGGRKHIQQHIAGLQQGNSVLEP